MALYHYVTLFQLIVCNVRVCVCVHSFIILAVMGWYLLWRWLGLG